MKSHNYLILGLFFIFALCGVFYIGADLLNQEEIPFMVESHGEYAFRTSNQLVEDSDLVIIGTAKKVESARWGTLDGKMPEGVILVKSKDKNVPYESVTLNLKPGETVYTDTIFEVSEVYKGQIASKEVIVRTIGGTVDGLQFKSGYSEDYQIEKEYMLFLGKGWDYKNSKWTDEFYFALTPQARILLTEMDVGIDAEGKNIDIKELEKLLEENLNKDSVR